MRAWKKAALVLLLCAALGVGAFAADANVRYVGNAGSIVCAPGSQYSLTDLFPNFKEVMPGATIPQRITVRNDADNRVKVRIWLRSHGSTDEAWVPFLEQLRLTVRKESDTPMFDANPDIPAGLSDWVCLGTLYSGGEVDLNVTLEVPRELDNLYQDLYGEILWEFMIEELPVSPDDPTVKTGDTTHAALWLGLTAACAASACAWLLIRRKQEKKRVEH